MIFFVLISGLRLQRYLTNTKKISPEKVFGNSEFSSSRQNHSSLKLRELWFWREEENSEFPKTFFGDIFFVLRELWFWWEEENSEFPKTFFGDIFFVFVEYLCNHSLKIKTKNFKNYTSILAIVNHHNWLSDSPPLSNSIDWDQHSMVNVCGSFYCFFFGVSNLNEIEILEKILKMTWNWDAVERK